MSAAAPAVDRYAVIGHPIAHSKSPQIHAAFAAQTGQRLQYGLHDVLPEALAGFLQDCLRDGVRGLNVTVPHKSAVQAACCAVTPRAQLAGAVNTLIATDDGWRGDNTDGEGLVNDLARLGIEVGGKRVLILGAGGATRGIIGPLLALQPAQLTVSNRNPWKPEALAETFKAIGKVTPRAHWALKGDRYDLILNATSAGLQGQMPQLPGQLLASSGVAYDLVYGPGHLPFRDWARAQGAARVEDGLGMLVEQAAVAFELWRGLRPDPVAVLQTLRESQG